LKIAGCAQTSFFCAKFASVALSELNRTLADEYPRLVAASFTLIGFERLIVGTLPDLRMQKRTGCIQYAESIIDMCADVHIYFWPTIICAVVAECNRLQQLPEPQSGNVYEKLSK
jgi:hypothetical protein